MAMKICILLAGRMDPGMGPGTPGISELVRALIHCNDPENEVELIETAVLDQQFPADVTEFDGYLITGSSYSVYQDLAWIHHLMDFIRSAYAANLPMAGICFGHQALAHALGGRVAHSTRGWGAGIRSTKVVSRAAWMTHGKESSLNLLYMHQDQVEMLPPGATLLLEDPFCPLGGFSMGETVFGVQGHPELSNDICGAIIRSRLQRIGQDTANAALETLKLPSHGDLVGKWIVRFFLARGIKQP